MKFISIDSSLANTGVAVGTIDSHGIHVDKILLHETSKAKNKQVRASSDTIHRCKETHLFLQKIIEMEKPKVIFVETPSGSQSASGMKSYGATCQLIAVLRPDPIQVTPTEVKVASVGNKSASKRAIIDWAYGLYPDLEWVFNKGILQNKMEHVADAIAIVYAGVKTPDFIRLQQLVS